MKKVNYLFFAILVSSILGCDKRKDFYGDINSAPKIEMRKKDVGSYSTGLNDSIKKLFPDYYLDLRVTDEENLSFNYSLMTATDKYMRLSDNAVKFTPDTSKSGVHSMVFTVTDAYEAAGTSTASFVIFDNLSPVALFQTTKIAVYDPLEYNIDASSSFDRDSKYGGQIVEYEFVINTSYKVNTQFNNINYIFPSIGNYTISIRVKDNNGIWSATKQIVLSVS